MPIIFRFGIDSSILLASLMYLLLIYFWTGVSTAFDSITTIGEIIAASIIIPTAASHSPATIAHAGAIIEITTATTASRTTRGVNTRDFLLFFLAILVAIPANTIAIIACLKYSILPNKISRIIYSRGENCPFRYLK